MFLMSRKIKAVGVKMVLSGEGADEVFGGYLYFHKAPNRVSREQCVQMSHYIALYRCMITAMCVIDGGCECAVSRVVGQLALLAIVKALTVSKIVKRSDSCC